MHARSQLHLDLVKKSTVMICDNGIYLGSGLLLSSNGFVVTCNHVIADAPNLYVNVGPRKVPALIYKRKPANDLAILKISGDFRFHTSPQNISEIRQGQRVFCFGFPTTRDQRKRNVIVIDGIISGLNRTKAGKIVSILVNAPVSKGFSGGPVVDVASGKVIGIVATKLTKHARRDGEIADGIAFCIPIDLVFSLVSNFELDPSRINWTDYANRLLTRYMKGAVFRNYIDLKCRDSRGERHDLMNYILNVWLPERKKTLLSILGDFGSGKTLLCHRLAYKLANDYLNGKNSANLPIVLKLRDYHQYGNVRALLKDQVATALGRSDLSWHQLEVMLCSGKILLIYDGFDEMAMKASRFQIMENFNEIRDTIMPKAKVVLTCRTHYFGAESEEQYTLTRTREPDFFENLISEGGELEQTSMVYIEDLTDHDVQTYLKNRLGKEWKHLYNRIKSPQFYDLNDLSKRPIFLDVIVKTIPKFEFIERRITGTELYQMYTELCFHREARSRGWLPEKAAELVEDLAFESYVKGYSYVTDTVVDVVSDRLATPQQKLKQFLRKCPFFKRPANTSGNFAFIHQSFFEFFVARKIAFDIGIRKHASYAAEYLTPQIDKYLLELLEADNNSNIVAIWLENHPDVNVRMNSALTLGRSGHKEFIPLLDECLAKEKDIGAAGRISEALVALGIKDAVRKFLGNLERYDQLKQDTGKSDAHKLLYDIVDPLKITNMNIVESLICNLSHPNARIRKYAAFMLGRIGNYESVPSLIRLLKESTETIRTRRYAAAALGLIGDSQAIPYLEEVSLHCKNEYLRQECLKAIRRIKERYK